MVQGLDGGEIMREIKETFYSFNINLAREVGVERSVILSNICYWTQHNQKNETNFHNERYWTFNSSTAYQKMYPFWSIDKIKRMLKSLVDEGYLITGCFNELKFDRTLWYSPSDHVVDLYNSTVQNCTTDGAELHRGRCGTAPTIPYKNTDIKPNNIYAADNHEEKFIPPMKKSSPPHEEIFTLNNKRNITNNNICAADSKVVYPRKQFKKPTLSEVREYIKEKHYSVDAVKFYEYYEAGDWHDAKGKPVKNWKQRLVTWNGRQQNDSYSKPKETNTWVEPKPTDEDLLDEIRKQCDRELGVDDG